MKTNFKISEMKKGIFHLVLMIILVVTSIIGVSAQEQEKNDHDYLMAQRGKSMLELYSGIPYVAIGQYSYGFSDRFSLGIIYGYTPFVRGYGLRMKAVIAEPSQSIRIYLKSPFIYYPKKRGNEKDPWVLAWPTLNVEFKLKNNARIWTGFGVIGAACTEYLLGTEEAKEMPDEEIQPAITMAKDEPMAELWNTFQIGYSKPVSNKLSFILEIAPVMKGLKFTTPHGLLDGLPVIVTTGLSYSF
jgi:hypothetical protein